MAVHFFYSTQISKTIKLISERSEEKFSNYFVYNENVKIGRLHVICFHHDSYLFDFFFPLTFMHPILYFSNQFVFGRSLRERTWKTVCNRNENEWQTENRDPLLGCGRKARERERTIETTVWG